MATRQYIGARYVIKIYENSQDPSSAEWEANTSYEPLTMVTYQNSSYLSKKAVPATVGNPPSNKNYWVVTGAYNGQIAELQRNVSTLTNYVDALRGGMYKTIYDYGYTSGSNITTYIQAFLDDVDAKELYIIDEGTYTINSVSLTTVDTNHLNKRIIKGSNTTISGSGASQLYISGDDAISYEYSADRTNQFPLQFIKTTNDDTTPYRVITNAVFEDHVINANDPHYHWNILAISDLYANGDGSNVCEYLQVRNHGQSSTWALCIESTNDAAITNETSNTIGIELLIKGKGDISTNGGSRVGLHIISAAHDSAGFQMNEGIIFESTSNNTSKGFEKGIYFKNTTAKRCIALASTCSTECAIDLHEATISGPAINLGFEHPIKFDNWTVREAYTAGIKNLVFEETENDTLIEFTYLTAETSEMPTSPAKFMRVFYNNTQYGIPLYAY